MVGSTRGCQNREDLGGNTSSELQDPLTHDKNYLGDAGPNKEGEGFGAFSHLGVSAAFWIHSLQLAVVAFPSHIWGAANVQTFVRAGMSRAGPHSGCVNGRRAVCIPAASSPPGLSTPQSSGTHCSHTKGCCRRRSSLACAPLREQAAPGLELGAMRRMPSKSWGANTAQNAEGKAKSPLPPPLAITPELGWQPSSPSECQQHLFS